MNRQDAADDQEGQMASVMLSLHSKQPKRGMVSCEKGYIEIMEYPRAWEAENHLYRFRRNGSDSDR